MNKRRVVTIIVGLVALAVLSLPMIQVEAQTGHQGHGSKMDMKHKMDVSKDGGSQTLSLEQIHMHMPMILKSIDGATKAVEAGHKKAALEELDKAKKMLIIVHQALGSHVKPTFANDRCPIMGSPIKPDKIGKNLIRDHKGQKVAFCCAGCLAQWDKLTDAGRDAKLAKVLAPVKTWTCSMHPQIRLAKPGQCPICNMKLIQVSESAKPKPIAKPHAGHKH